MPTPKKLLIRIGSLRHGGAEKVLATFLQNLPQGKYDIDLLLNLYSGKYLEEIPKWIEIKYLNKGEMITTNRLQDIPQKAYRVLYQNLLKIFPKLLYNNTLKGKQYDIEFAAIHGLSDDILNSPNSNSKKLVWIHNDLSEVEGYDKEKIRKLFNFDAILVISEKIEKLFRDVAKNKEEESKINRIYNPIDTEDILQKSAAKIEDKELLKFLNENDKGPLFISVGTVFPQKGYDRLLKVHRKLLDEGFQHRVLIVGDGYDMPNILKLRNELGVEDTAYMAGFQPNPYPLFKAADFYILSSRYEGYPTVLFEAITLGKNIIATEVSGVREMLHNGELGEIVENSEEGIYKGMKKAIQNPKAFQGYQEKMTNFNFPFSLENSVQQIQNIIDEL